MDRGRRTSTVRQLDMLVEFAEGHRDLALGRLRSKEGRALSTRLWRECAAGLNSEGPARLPKEWAKVWNDMKSRVRAKLTCLTLSQRGTGGGPPMNITLSAIEERVADVIGRDIGPIPNVAQDPFLQASSEEQPYEVVYMQNISQHATNEDKNDLQQHLPEPSISLPCLSPPQPMSPGLPPQPSSPPPQPSSPPPLPSLPLSVSSTPRRRRQRPQRRPYQGSQRASRVQTQAQTSRTALDESRAMAMRIEELRARNECMLNECALRQAEAAKAQAEVAVLTAQANQQWAQTMATFCTSLASLVPAIKLCLERWGTENISEGNN